MSHTNKDLHIHTWYSDGTDSPKEAIKWAYDMGMSEIAITDHDNMDGVSEAMKIAEEYGMIFHTGIEFSTEEKHGVGLHLLGYDINIADESIKKRCREIAKTRDERNQRMMALLYERYGLTLEDVKEREGQTFLGKPMMARALVRKGVVDSIGEAFNKIFSREEFRRLKKDKITVYEAIDLVKNAGGKAVLAHPGRIRNIGKAESREFYDNIEKILQDLITHGLDGLECIYSKHSKTDEREFIKMAKKYNLIITSGSDYHGRD